jgi:hypothetical protein
MRPRHCQCWQRGIDVRVIWWLPAENQTSTQKGSAVSVPSILWYCSLSDSRNVDTTRQFWIALSPVWTTRILAVYDSVFDKMDRPYASMCLFICTNTPITLAVAVQGMNSLRPLEHWDRGFKPHSRPRCLCAFCVCVVPCVGSDLAAGWSPSKDFYRVCTD